MLEGRRDVAVLRDLRVAPAARRRGVGATLFEAAGARCVARRIRRLEVETQSVSAPACRRYARLGCELRAIHRFAHPELLAEAQLLWYEELAHRSD